MITASGLAESSLRLLVVDDEAAILEMLTWMLEDAGHNVFGFERAEPALAFLDDGCAVDLVLSDVNMPGMDGVMLRRHIGDRWPALPVLLTSGRPPPGNAGPFLPKPFSTEALLSAMFCLLPARSGRERAA